MVVIKKLDDMKKMISKICLFLFIALIAVSCEDFPVVNHDKSRMLCE